jgi:integrase
MATQRRSRGSGSVYKHHNGMFYYQWIDANGQKHAKSLRTKNRKEALGRAGEFERAIHAKDKVEVLHQAAEAQGIIRRRALPLASVWPEYLKTKPTAGSGTLRNYERALNDFIGWLSSHYPAVESFTEQTPEIADEYLEFLWQSGPSANTYNYRKNAIGAIVKALAGRYGIESNRWHDSATRRREVKQKRLPLSAKQCIELMQALSDTPDLPHPDECRALVRFLLFTGARLADAVNMRWDSIDISRARIQYTPRKTAGRGKVAELPILPPIHDELGEMYSKRDGDLVFPNLAALYERNPDGLQKPLVELIQSVTGDGRGSNGAAGQRRISRAAYGVHSLRTTFATQAAMSGCKPVWLARMMGDSLSTVDKYYIQAGLHDTTVFGFDHLPMLTDGGNQTTDPEREQLHQLVESLPIKAIRALLKAATDYSGKSSQGCSA